MLAVRMISAAYDFRKDESAPTFVEYGFILLVIALVVVVGASEFGQAVLQLFQSAEAATS